MTSLPQVDYKKEVRFAVVMYGGVSLAIYINGVSQELFKLARATARAGEGQGERPGLSGAATASMTNSLNGTERVYRKVSHLLSDKELQDECRALADAGVNDKEKQEALRNRLERVVSDDSIPIQTGFIVDILSGTSAGGINSIYLAKALANEQRIDRLKQLWINEGDIGLLLNDSDSLKGTVLEAQNPPQSLLNSRRMYLKLLRALDDMDRDDPATPEHDSPYTSELDLFITATDIEGVPVPLKLSDKIVFERRHRNVFHFEYKSSTPWIPEGEDKEPLHDGLNDFVGPANPFLAFAARCTSSFPFAFEPMRLIDIDDVLQRLPDYFDRGECKSDSPNWKRYFREVLDPRTGVPNLRYSRRSFGDGGYLDNKPFSFAIEALVRRNSDVPVDRRLIYIEPSPDHPEDIPETDYKPDALENVKAALLDLPTYETIREDLQRVLQRNLLIERVQRIIKGIERDINTLLPHELKDKLKEFSAKLEHKEKQTGEVRPEWSQKNLPMMVKEKGRAYLSYQKLRIGTVTDDLARLIARLLNFDANSDLLLSLRCLVRAWREANYFDYKDPSVNKFLTDYDFSHRIRRLTFIREKIDALYDYSPALQSELAAFSTKHGEVQKLLDGEKLHDDRIREFREQNPDIGWLLGLLRSGDRLANLDDTQLKELRDTLIFMKCEVNKVYKDFLSKGRLLRQRRNPAKKDGDSQPVNPILESFEAIGIKTEHLNYILDIRNVQAITGRVPIDGSGTPNEDDCNLIASDFLKKNTGETAFAGKLDQAAVALKTSVAETVTTCRQRMKELLDPEFGIEAKSDRGRLFKKAKARKGEGNKWASSELLHAVREYLAYYYHNFDEYDQIGFPIFYQADVGEASLVEVIRISPEDATSLIDEREEMRRSPDGKGRQKLAGVALAHFGAFLDRTWRQNDIMWGRLDGAERLISTLLPGHHNENLRAVLIEEAHTSILIDELPPESRLQLGGIVSEALVRASAGEPIEQAVVRVTKDLKNDTPVRTRLEAVVRSSLNNDELLEFIRTGYEVNRKLDPKPLLTSISRSTQIIGKVFEDIANANQLDGKSLAWVARLGQIFWGLVEIAVPNTIRNMLFRRWLSFIYAFELFTIVFGLVLGSQGAQQFGWTALGITAVVNILVLVLTDVMRGRRAVFRATAVIVGLTVLGLAGLGLLELLGPIFNVRIPSGEAKLYPMYYLKETAKNWLPGQGEFHLNLFRGLGLVLIAAVLLTLNKFFGVVRFSWLDHRWQLLRKWFAQSDLKRFWPGGRFKPIKVLADDIESKTRIFPGKEDLYLIPFSLSSMPANEWINLLESNFKNQGGTSAAVTQQLAVSNQEVLVVSSPAELDSAFQRLSFAASEANKAYSANLLKRAKEDYKNHRRLMEISSGQVTGDPSIPSSIRSQLETLRLAATSRMRKLARNRARILGSLLIAMGLLIVTLQILIFYRAVKADLPTGFRTPGIALQLARTTQDAVKAFRAHSVLRSEPAKTVIQGNIQVDWGLIFSYVLILSFVSYWLARGRPRREQRIARGAIAAVIVAGVADVLENFAILGLNENAITTESVQDVFLLAIVKWTALFITLAFIGWLCCRRKRTPFTLVGLMLLVTAAVGIAGVVVYRPAVEWGFILMGLSATALGLVFLIAPKTLEPARRSYIDADYGSALGEGNNLNQLP